MLQNDFFFFSLLGPVSILLLSLANVDSRSSQYWHSLQAQCQDLINLYSSWCRFLFVILELVCYLYLLALLIIPTDQKIGKRQRTAITHDKNNDVRQTSQTISEKQSQSLETIFPVKTKQNKTKPNTNLLLAKNGK